MVKPKDDAIESVRNLLADNKKALDVLDVTGEEKQTVSKIKKTYPHYVSCCSNHNSCVSVFCISNGTK